MGLKNACYLIIEFVHVRGLKTSNNEFLDVESLKLVKLTKTSWFGTTKHLTDTIFSSTPTSTI